MTKKLKLAVAARGIGRVTGVEKYISGFLDTLVAYRQYFDIHIYYNSPASLGYFPQVREHCLPSCSRLLWDHVWLPIALRREEFDLVIYTKNVHSLIGPARALLIVYDTGYFYPELKAYRRLETLYMKNMLRYSARDAWGILTISESTRQDVLRWLNIEPGKVLAIHGDTTGEFAPVHNEKVLQDVRLKYRLAEPFIFYPTDISPRKNLLRLLEAFETIQDQIPHTLFLTGGREWNAREILKRLDQMDPKRVRRLGSIEAKDMPALYSLADFTVYISLFEGLGLPVLEAFRCGSPLLASNQTSIPEVAGDAAYLVNGYSVEEIADGLLALAQDPGLKARLRVAGFERAEQFSWEKTVRKAVQWIEVRLHDELGSKGFKEVKKKQGK